MTRKVALSSSIPKAASISSSSRFQPVLMSNTIPGVSPKRCDSAVARGGEKISGHVYVIQVLPELVQISPNSSALSTLEAYSLNETIL